MGATLRRAESGDTSLPEPPIIDTASHVAYPLDQASELFPSKCRVKQLSTEALALRYARRPWSTVGIWALMVIAAIVLINTILADGLTTRFVFNNTSEPQRGVGLIEELRDSR